VADITDAFAPPPTEGPAPPPPTQAEGKVSTNFVTLYGVAGLNTYLVERRALTALPLLLAIQRRLDMKRKARVSITSGVWKDAGNPPRNTRVTMLAHLRRMPELVILHEARRVTSRYRVEKGPAWQQIEKDGREGVGKEEEEDD
jgi:hypothetical protein